MPGVGIAIMLAIRIAVYMMKGSKGPIFNWRINPGAGLLVLRIGLLMFAAAFVGGSNWPVAAFLALWIIPHPLIDHVLVPAGIPHLSYYASRFFFPYSLANEGRGRAVFNEIRARLRWDFALDEAGCSELGEALFVGWTDAKVRGGDVAARGMLDALAGNLEAARAWFNLAQSSSYRQADWAVRRYSQAWLLADAARRGAHHEVLRLSRRGPFTIRRLFFRGASARLLRLEGAPSDRKLGLLWLLSPGRRVSQTLLRQAKLRPVVPFVTNPKPDPRRQTVRFARRAPGSISRDELRRLALAWQEQFTRGELTDYIETRRQELNGAFSATELGARVEESVISMLADFWRHSPSEANSNEPDPSLIVAAKDHLQSELLGELEALCGALDRGDETASDEFEDYWRAWAQIRWLAEEYLDLLPERSSLLFNSVGGQLLNHGAWLCNKARARSLGRDIFRWLHPLAPAESENKAVLTRNLKLVG